MTGMTCGHCVTSVTGAIQQIEGVSDVTVDLANRRVTVISSSGPVSGDAVTAAVREAGYQMG
ncbi:MULTISPECIES: heavy-metal-associated domain-containing protein [unclassified Nocardioides]|uniref:heavy-metal-associated domain-containing protein n=1 Tax=unclassified Nocardioides TaxID=2615069 RepID=UPI000700039A|nr:MULTISPECIES: cation transporter [unclassified Nocardioides]KQY57390.1 cation-transporting ATPase [Nocardioides sp. Root140]KQZ68903.1 cation-transporting ATPase [Nocardioides sp. Root151]KRF20420.1 cation-transporting ATPase [Nocardioides sp. Soil796]